MALNVQSAHTACDKGCGQLLCCAALGTSFPDATAGHVLCSLVDTGILAMYPASHHMPLIALQSIHSTPTEWTFCLLCDLARGSCSIATEKLVALTALADQYDVTLLQQLCMDAIRNHAANHR